MAEDVEDFRRWAEAHGLIPDADEVMQKPEFEITSDTLALWAIRLIERAEAEVTQRERERNQQMADLEAWVDEARRAALAKRAWCEGKLEGYLRAQQAAGRLGDKKSLSLPGGRRLQYRYSPPEYEMTDKDAFLGWCMEQAVYRIEPRWGEAKKRFLNGDEADYVGGPVHAESVNILTGETTVVDVPGVRLTRVAGDRFSVQVAKPAVQGKVGGDADV